MPRWSSRAAWRVAVALFALLAVSSCSKKKILVDPTDGLEGVASASQMVVWAETPNPVSTYADTLTPGPNPDTEPPDRLLGVEDVYALGPGVVHGAILDYTSASRFDVFRDAGSGFRLLKDFDVSPLRRYLFSQTDLFPFTDQHPGARALQRYVGRGVVEGVTTQLSPKTNIGRVTLAAVAGDLHFTAPTGIPPDFRPAPDSLLALAWDAYPGAAGYWVHVYQFTTQGGDEIIRSGIPQPYYFGVTRDFFLAYFPASVTSYRMGLNSDGTPTFPLPGGARIITEKSLVNSQIYNVRVSAVNDNGELIAYTGLSGTIAVFRQETTYRAFPLGAVRVNTKAVAPPPGPASPARETAIAGDAAGVWYYPPGTYPKRLP